MKSNGEAEQGGSVPAPRRRRKMWRLIMALLCCVVLFYTAVGWVCTTPLIGENARWRGMNRGPKDFGLKGETVSLRSTDGIALKAWWLPADGEARGTVIIAHGVDHTRQVMLPRAVFLVHGGYNVLALDLRGHGESAAQYVSGGYLEARDVLGAVEYVRGRGEQGRIAVLGVSMGAAASVLAAAQSKEISAVVADGIFPTGAVVWASIDRHMMHDPRSGFVMRTAALVGSCPGIPTAVAAVFWARTGVWIGTDLVNVLPEAAKVRVPVLVISGSRDWIVPTDEARKVLAALGTQRKSLVVIPDAEHDTTYGTAQEMYSRAVLDFLNGNMGK